MVWRVYILYIPACHNAKPLKPKTILYVDDKTVATPTTTIMDDDGVKLTKNSAKNHNFCGFTYVYKSESGRLIPSATLYPSSKTKKKLRHTQHLFNIHNIWTIPFLLLFLTCILCCCALLTLRKFFSTLCCSFFSLSLFHPRNFLFRIFSS